MDSLDSVIASDALAGKSSDELERIVVSESQLREAQELASIGSWQWDVRSDTITWSDQLYRIYGVDRESFDTSFESFMQLIHPDDRELLGNTVQQAMATGQPYSVDHRIVRPNGEVAFVHGQGAVVTDENNQPIRLYGVAQDMTEQRLAYQQRLDLEQAQKASHYRQQLLSMLAHELNTPLTPLQTQTMLLMRDKDQLNESTTKVIDILDRNVRRLAKLVSDVLDMSRAEAGTLTIHRQAFPAMRAFQETIDTFQTDADAAGVSFDTSDVSDFDFEADEHRIIQVLQNLVKNAIKFTPSGGTIRFHAHQGEDATTLAVEDTGRGISADKIERLFAPFSQVHEDQGSGGHGLGLYISRTIVEAHGGTLVAESLGEDRGTTFRITIPNESAE